MKRIAILLLSAISIQLSAFGQGSLTPPGPPAPTFKTLQQVEPRTPITNLPYTISQPGSYYLTTNLTGNPGGITISTNGVTLDLMGFELVGGTGSGILFSGGRRNIAIHNGTVRDWTSDGISASTVNGQFRDLRLYDNAGSGISYATGAVVNCIASGNGAHGFSTRGACVVSGCVGIDNGSDGVATLGGSTVSGCTVFGNNRNGITTGFGSTVSGCTAYQNTSNGISVSANSAVIGCTASQNSGDGIVVQSGCYVTGNTCNGNGSGGDGAGIHATATDNRIDSNHVAGNNRGIDLDAAGNLIIRNSATANATNYVFTGTQTFGPTNTVTGQINPTNTSAWANFSF